MFKANKPEDLKKGVLEKNIYIPLNVFYILVLKKVTFTTPIVLSFCKYQSDTNIF